MRKERIVGLLLICLLVLTGCEQSFEIPLHQPIGEIAQIDLLDHRSGDFIVLRTLENEQIEIFMESFLQLKCYKYLGGPQGEFGDFAVKVFYADGGIDLFGTGACAFASPGGEEDFEGWLYLHQNELIPLFAEYVNPSLLPRITD